MDEDISLAVDVGRDLLWTALKLGAPILLIGMGIGLVAAFLQTVTSLNESSLSFVPKLLGMTACFLVLLPWMLVVLVEYAEGVFGSMATWFP